MDSRTEGEDALPGETFATYTPIETGSYYVKVRSNYNGDYSYWVSSKTYHVS